MEAPFLFFDLFDCLTVSWRNFSLFAGVTLNNSQQPTSPVIDVLFFLFPAIKMLL